MTDRHYVLIQIFSRLCRRPGENTKLKIFSPHPYSNLRPELIYDLVNIFNVNIFVETGTNEGRTSQIAANYFMEVHTIEFGQILFERAKKSLRNFPHVYCYLGDSSQTLREILPKISGNLLFWLDAHYCGGDSVKSDKGFCPIRSEIAAILEQGPNNPIILIDDIRVFIENSYDHFSFFQTIEDQYPTLQEINNKFLEADPSFKLKVLGDLCIIYKDPASNIKVSPIVENCTKSRLFDHKHASFGETIAVIQAEENLSSFAYTEDANELVQLYNNKWYKGSPHYALWYGLVQQGKRNWKEAQMAYKEAIKFGCYHWRVYWYLAKVERKLGLLKKSREHVEHVINEAPQFEDAKHFY